MFTNSLNISSKGQITLPKKIRQILSTNIVKIEVTDDNKVILLPVKDLGGSLSTYKREKNSSFPEIRDQAWQEELSNKLNSK